MAKLTALTAFLDDYLQIARIPDFPNAHNGLQLANSGTVGKIGAAVDAVEATLAAAAARGIDLLVVHHGLFWGGGEPITGPQYRRLRSAFAGDLALYSAHLPLDVHPRVGNNALLARVVGLAKPQPFYEEMGCPIGLRGQVSLSRAALVARVENAVGGPVRVCPAGPGKVRRLGIVTGAAGSGIKRAAAAGIDTLVTGEGPHWSFLLAEELGVNLILAGHYATETFGVKAVAALLARRFKLGYEFIDHPTGL